MDAAQTYGQHQQSLPAWLAYVPPDANSQKDIKVTNMATVPHHPQAHHVQRQAMTAEHGTLSACLLTAPGHQQSQHGGPQAHPPAQEKDTDMMTQHSTTTAREMCGTCAGILQRVK
jgi:hypothetical protein